MKKLIPLQLLLIILFCISVVPLTGQAKGPDDENAPWHSLKYECYGKGEDGHLYKGVEILQVPVSEDAESVTLRIYLRLTDRHPKHHKHVFVDKFANFNTRQRESWYVLINPPKGHVWESPETITIPKKWNFKSRDFNYTATWNPKEQRYDLSNYKDQEPYDRISEQEMFGVHIECYEHDPEPAGQDKYMDSYDDLTEDQIIRYY